ncbi:MAG: oxaloacetate decarboxylase [Acidimicrobiia bacterium]
MHDTQTGPGTKLLSLLDANDLTVVPGVHDVLSALLVERCGFNAAYLGGYALTACAFGLPDSGVITVAELIEHGRRIIDVLSIPLIVDIDDGGGTPLRITRNVRSAARAGAAAVQIEDVDLARGKHFPGLPHHVMPLDRAVENVRAAATAARAESDMLIIARTDLLFTGPLEEAIARVNAFADVGADIVLICMLPPTDIRRTASEVTAPLLNLYIRDEARPDQIAQARADGLRLVVPTSLTFRAQYAAVREALEELKETEHDPTLESWARVAADIDATVGIDNWAAMLR